MEKRRKIVREGKRRQDVRWRNNAQGQRRGEGRDSIEYRGREKGRERRRRER